VLELKEAVPQKEQSFWVLLEAKLNEVLTPNEVVKFIAEMKKVENEQLTALKDCNNCSLFLLQNIKDVPSIINLEDLDNAASLIV